VTVDLLIVGAGPAGLAAAAEAARLGLSTMLLDENAAPGGRIWQAVERRSAADADEHFGLDLIREVRAGPVQTHFGAAVWAIEPDGTVFWSQEDMARSVAAKTILLATGTTERPLPIAGWTLPGVMTVGAAQITLKTGGLVPTGRTWLAGQGPLLLLYAQQLLDAGGQLSGIIDLSDGFAPLRALRFANTAAWPDIWRGMLWRGRLARSGVPWIAASDLRAEGDGVVRRVEFETKDGWRGAPADTVLLHDGVIPTVQLTRALGCVHAWSKAQRCWYPMTDDWGRTSLDNVLVAGDGAGIGGAMAAVLSGRIAVLGLRDETRPLADALRFERAQRLAVRPFLDTMFAPRPRHLDDATLVCRCEAVTAGEVRQAAANGCLGMNQLKAYTRCGMGPCQGRMCAPVAIEVLAEARGVPVPDIAPLRTRFPTKPIRVGELVDL
jgi:NADPH-dependent 2,4-dienoyl-CoA reductase/sulfur reductase-like enzyme